MKYLSNVNHEVLISLVSTENKIINDLILAYLSNITNCQSLLFMIVSFGVKLCNYSLWTELWRDTKNKIHFTKKKILLNFSPN